MNKPLPFFLALCTAACGLPSQAAEPALAPRSSGIEASAMDPQVRPQNDLFRHVNGRWLATTAIPPDRASIGAFEDLREHTRTQLRELIASTTATANEPYERQIAALYASYSDEATLEGLGARPLAAELAAIEAVSQPRQLSALLAHLARLHVGGPLSFDINQDARDATRYTPQIGQARLGLPDRDYYLLDDDARFQKVRSAYRSHLAHLFTLASDTPLTEPAAQTLAQEVLALETELARAQWTQVELRDPVKNYHRMTLAQLQALAPQIDWPGLWHSVGFEGRAVDAVVGQPSYLSAVGRLLESTPLPTWKAYARAQLLMAYAPYLSPAFVDERFSFVGPVLRGTTQNRPRWQRGVALVDELLGDALGRLYVAKHFPPEHKARMERLVANLLAAYAQSIDHLDWMSPATKREARAKLATFMPKIGYPKRWIDYSRLKIAPNDLVGNVMRAREFDFERQLAKLGQPIDRDEWGMHPQTVNAYYNPSLNEIVFPAAMLQPPFFTASADDAVNYGGIGAIIGHEISHGFDDEGSQFDALGNLRDWWTTADRQRFKRKTDALVAQYSAYVPVPGYPLNGELTLGENIADNAGLAIAYKAYRLSLRGHPAPVIDGLSGDQRFYFGFAQIWRGLQRENAMLTQIKADPHAPNEFRANGSVANHTPFYKNFGVKPGDALYRPPVKRVSLW